MKYDFTTERSAYNVLKKIFCDGAYSSIELDRALDSAPEQCRGKITALVYGVLEKSVTLDYYIDVLTKNKVKKNLEVLLKMGLYERLFGNDPDYAVTGRYVSFARDRFSGAQGFVNAVLRHVGDVELPSDDAPASLSVRYSQPLWLVNELLSAYGQAKTISILSAEKKNYTHIRRNSKKISSEEFDALLLKFKDNGGILPTNLGYYVTHSTLKGLKSDIFTAQSLSSMYAVNIYAEDYIGKSLTVLDLCAAPGGKSIYFQELVPNAKITACDVHEHRVGLIKSYASRMGAKIETTINDATKLREDFIDSFDVVICDVPCTGSGLLVSSPDILLFKTADDIRSLSKIQSAILKTAARYVKSGGELIYSTCSILPTENEHIIDDFIIGESDFVPVSTSLPYGRTENGKTWLLPDADGCDGFFIAKMRRAK